jgi:hypothetical protein
MMATCSGGAFAQSTGNCAGLADMLGHIQYGTQVGVVKVFGADGTVLFKKGLDSDMLAQVSAPHRYQIFQALGIDPTFAPKVAEDIIENYDALPHAPALALLGVIASGSPPNQDRIQNFLCDRLQESGTSEGERVVVRQAGLALAAAEPISPNTASRVARFFATVDNRWLEYPIVEFFKFHGAAIAQMPNRQDICNTVHSSPSFFADQMLESVATMSCAPSGLVMNSQNVAPPAYTPASYAPQPAYQAPVQQQPVYQQAQYQPQAQYQQQPAYQPQYQQPSYQPQYQPQPPAYQQPQYQQAYQVAPQQYSAPRTPQYAQAPQYYQSAPQYQQPLRNQPDPDDQP